MSVSDIAAALATARSEARLATLPPDSIASVDDAYAVQSELIRLSRDAVKGWKVSALLPVDQQKYRAKRPVAGPLLESFVHVAPATISRKTLVAPLFECEVAFVLGRDLPEKAAPYARSEIEAAIAAVVPAFELADCRLAADSPAVMKLADAMGNGAFVTGRPIENWRAIDLTAVLITLKHDGAVIAEGESKRILGDPLLAVLALANAQPLPAPGLKASQVITTGSCITPIAISAGRYTADFGPLGEMEMTVID